MELFGFILEIYAAIGSLLSEAAQTTFVQNLIVYSIMWYVIKSTVAKHFGKIENSLDRIATGLEKHEKRIEALEGRGSLVIMKASEKPKKKPKKPRRKKCH